MVKQIVGSRVLLSGMITNTTISNSRWDPLLETPRRPAAARSESLFARLGAEPRPSHCPFCHSIVYTRRHPRCGACGGTLPDECLFTGREARNVEMLMRAERERHRAWLERAGAGLPAVTLT